MLIGAVPALAQIDISPFRVLLTVRERTAEIVVTNSLDEMVEATAEFNFKILRSDSLGNKRLDTVLFLSDLANSSCHGWLKLFPRRFTLPPRGSRSLRIVAIPPDSIPDGEYWARLEVTGERTKRRPIDTDTSNLSVTLNMRLRVGIPITFRKGSVETGIAIDSVAARRLDSGSVLLVDTRRLGNAVYRGTLAATIRGAAGENLEPIRQEYTNETQLRVALPIPSLPEGVYDLNIESSAERRGTISSFVLPSPTVARMYRLLVTPDRISVTAAE